MATATGIISGTPTVNGTFNFTATVADNGTPVQTASATSSIVVAAVQSSGPGTWYVRPDGGTRYSSNVPSGQCNGRFDASYASTGGTGTNQNCAFNDFRYMWDDKSGAVGAGTWVIAGGDTVIIRGCTASANQSNASNPNCRIGWDGPTGPTSGNWCYGVGSYTCYNPPIPAGTATQHTRILGQCVLAGNCNTGNTTERANLSQMFGGFSLTWTFNLGSTQYVDIQGIEVTTHNGVCSRGGSPGYPRDCNSSQPLDDYAQVGFLTNNTTANITFQDVYVHGFNASGLNGPIGGPITMTRMFIGFNAQAGWNFDDGSDTPDAAGSSITASYVAMEGNGCKEQYPIVNGTYPASACWDSNSGGFGDGWSGQDTILDSFICDHCSIIYNTKDGFIGPHTQITALTITNSVAIGNMGAQWKWAGGINGTVLFQNNLTVTNCIRMAEALPGAVQNFALSTGLGGSYLSNFCRAGGAGFANIIRNGSVNNFYGNTVVAAGNIIFLEGCGYYSQGNVFNPETNCVSVPNTLKNNNFLGYTDPNIGAPSALYYPQDAYTFFTGFYNNEFGLKGGTTDTCGTNNNTCVNPLMVNEPSQVWLNEAALDVFNPLVGSGNSFYPTPSSPLIGAGTTIPGLTTDYFGTKTTSPPVIGAVQP
jgi:hypothetical protein